MATQTQSTVSMSSPGVGRVLHFAAWAARSGAERLVLNLCKATRDLEPAIWFPREGPMVAEFEDAGIPRLTTKDVLADPAATRSRFSLLHIHCGGHEPGIHRTARRLGMRSLTTLHSYASLPELDCPLICVAPHTAAVQDPYNHVRVIPNSIDTGEFTPGPPAPAGRMVIVRVCRPDRCAPYFLDAMRGVLDRHPGAELWLIGETGASDSRVRYFGSVGGVASLLRQADVFAYAPLPDAGAHDLCVLEAMAAGVPPVVTDVCSVRDSVTHLHDGMVVPFDSPEAFAAAVERLIDDAALRSELSRNARSTAVDRFSLDRLASDYRCVYEEVLSTPPPTPEDDIRRSVRSFAADRARLARFERNLVLLHDTLESTAMAGRYWVIGGMLIGWAREGRILRHDARDADFGVLQDDAAAFLDAVPALTAAGFEPLARYVDNRGVPVEYAFRKDGARFDFFLHEHAGENIRCTFFNNSPLVDDSRPIQLTSELPRYDLGPMEFLGRVWRKPEDHESFLAAEYGDWRTPNPAFDHRADDRSVVLVSWWTNAALWRFEV